ncbi:MAG TPA: IPExxxVDY family protein [Bacteroidia bacterium]|jgi:hypothetical protein|nr:IPExxxVDY family protein [Bacteroidia bacterium]
MPKFRLDVEYDYDFFLVGISCHEKPYRLCWAINKELELNLEQTEPFKISLKKNAPPTEFPLFAVEDTQHETAIYLISNRGENQLLIPEHERADYFFIVKGPFTDADKENMMRKMKSISFVLMSYSIAPDTLKSKQNLVF